MRSLSVFARVRNIPRLGLQCRGVHLLRDFKVPTIEEDLKWVVPVRCINPPESRDYGHVYPMRWTRHRSLRELGHAGEADRRHRQMAWTARPTNILLIQKVNDERTRMAMGQILKYVAQTRAQLMAGTSPRGIRISDYLLSHIRREIIPISRTSLSSSLVSY